MKASPVESHYRITWVCIKKAVKLVELIMPSCFVSEILYLISFRFSTFLRIMYLISTAFRIKYNSLIGIETNFQCIEAFKKCRISLYRNKYNQAGEMAQLLKVRLTTKK